jgi:glucose-1-phosphate thymidylyltransferase
VGRFGALDIDDDGFLRKIVRDTAPGEEEIYSSMNCFSFTPQIFEACRKVPMSARGELELPQAVELGIREMGMRVRAVKVAEPVLDMSSRADVSSVAARLASIQITI